MIGALWTAATGMSAQQLNVDIISNNLANVNTNGYKKVRVDFQDLFYQTLKGVGHESGEGINNPAGIQVGMGTRPVSTQKLYSQGTFQQTENPLDLSIEGKGFFQVIMPDGETAYTRSGSFKIDSEGNLVTSDGFPLEPQITIPDDTVEVRIGVDGTVSARTASSSTPTLVGNIEIAKFVNPAGLNSIGRNLMQETIASGAPTTGTPGAEGLGTISQGYLEMSNVKVIEEMVSLITAQRAYEINSRAIQTADSMIEITNNIRR